MKSIFYADGSPVLCPEYEHGIEQIAKDMCMVTHYTFAEAFELVSAAVSDIEQRGREDVPRESATVEAWASNATWHGPVNTTKEC